MINYLMVDLGTGNSRVALVSSAGKIVDLISSENTYYPDPLYANARQRFLVFILIIIGFQMYPPKIQ